MNAAASRVWRVVQGSSTATVRAPDINEARVRAAAIGFKNPDSIVLQEAPQAPAGMATVTDREFFDALKADPRDIMPTTESREFTLWRVVSTRAVFGWSAPGWANPGAPKAWALYRKGTAA